MRATARVVACAVALPALGQAAQWTAVPQFAVSADTDSNRRLQQVAKESESGVVAGALTFARLTETGSLMVTPRAVISRYSGEDALDSDDWGVSAAWRTHGERTDFSLNANITDDSALVTELGETGFVEGNTRRRSTSASALFTQYLETRHMLQYQLATTYVDYQRSAGTGLLAYKYPAASILYAYTVSPRLDVTLTANAARLTADSIALVNETRGGQLGVRYRISERFDFEAGAGRSTTESRGRRDSEQSFHASLSWHDEISQLTFSASRDVEPSGRGLLVNADDVRAEYSRNLSEKLSLQTSLRLSRRQDFDFTGSRSDYRYGAGALALSWRLDEQWTLAFAGLYSRQEYSNYLDPADGKRFGINLAWRPVQP